MTIQTNQLGLTAWRNLKNVGLKQRRASTRLSSGYRINSAADDAAGLAISEKLRAQIRGLDQADRNTRDGFSLLQTMDGGLSVIGDMLIRKRELTIQALNDTNTDEDKRQIQREVNELITEITASANRTQFNTVDLLNRPGASWLGGGGGGGASPSNPLVFGPGVNIVNATGLPGAGEAGYFGTTLTVRMNPGVSHTNFASWYIPQGTRGAIFVIAGSNYENIGVFTGQVSLVSPDGTIIGLHSGNAGSHGTFNTPSGTVESIVTGAVNNNNVAGSVHMIITDTTVSGNWTIMLSSYIDSPVREFYFLIASQPDPNVDPDTIRPPHIPDLWIQSGANFGQGLNLPVFDARAAALGVVGLDVTTWDGGNAALLAIDNALNQINSYRVIVGAHMNRLDYIHQNLQTASENMKNANSRIRDADMALEMMRLTASNVLNQAAMAMLAQSHQAQERVLALLR
ncbi:MAG: hypothetical protein FWC16_07225 [Defluviitaleaceae bacterium]|nr:hypothetical protein [Defluviitaleaceae bacterium]MCL2274704.1 hypothetical protein [Defluviitaleaceae bacterium]